VLPLHRIAALPKGLDMSLSDKIVLNNGISMPRLGLGVYQSGGAGPVKMQ
jgi:hypothetical protein